MKNKIKILSSLGILFLILNFYVLAVNGTMPVESQNVQFSLDPSTNITACIFNSSTSTLKIGNHFYDNIVPQTNGSRAFIAFDVNGTIIEANFTVNQKGATYVFGNDQFYAPPNANVIFKNGKITISVQNNTKFDTLPHSVPNPNLNLKNNQIEINGEGLELPNKNILHGSILFNEDKIYLTENSAIDTLYYTGQTFDNNKYIRLFLDGQEHKETIGNYFSVNGEKREAFLHINPNNYRSEPHPLVFVNGNPFIDVNRNNVILHIGKLGFDLAITNPPNQISNLNFKNIITDSNQEKLFENGNINLQYSSKFFGNDISIAKESKSDKKDYSSAPMTISFDNPKLIGEENILLIDSDSSSYGVYPMDSTELGKYATRDYHSTIMDKARSEEINLLKSSFKSLNFQGVTKLHPDEILNLKSVLETVPSNLLSNTKKVTFFEPREPSGQLSDVFIGGYATGDSINLNNLDAHTVYHELAHNYQMHITSIRPSGIDSELLKNKNDELVDSFVTEANNLLNSQGKNNVKLAELNKRSVEKGEVPVYFSEGSGLNILLDNPNQITSKELNELIKKYNSKIYNLYPRTLENQWLRIQDPTDYYNSDANDRTGFVTDYAKSHPKEDMAEFTAVAYTQPEKLKELINPKKEGYNKIYRQKLDLLYKYGFVTTDKYQEILNIAGVQ